MPNFVDPNLATRYNWNYYVAASEPYDRRIDTARIDWSPRDNWQLFFSGTNNADHQNVPYDVGNTGFVTGSMNFVLSPISYSQPGKMATIHATTTLSPTLVQRSFGVGEPEPQRLYAGVPATGQPDQALGIDIPQRNPSLNPLNLIPRMTFSGIQNYANPELSSTTPGFWFNTTYTFIDNLSKIHGTHSFKAGIYCEHTVKLQTAGRGGDRPTQFQYRRK